MRRLIGLLVALAAIDVIVLALPGFSGGWRLVVHIAATIAGFVVMVRIRPLGIRGGVLGIFGPAGLLVAHALAWRRQSRLPAPVVMADPTAQESTSTGARMLDGRMRHAAPETLGSLVTVLRHGSVSARRRALETVVRSFEPALSPLIARALADGDQTIRALAAAAAARMSRNLTQRRAVLAARVERGDTVAEDALIALLSDHARANVLLSDAQRDQLRRDVMAILKERPAGDARNHKLETILAEAAWAAGDYELIDELASRHREPAANGLGWWRGTAAAA